MEPKIGLLIVGLTGFKEYFEKLFEHNSPHKVKLGDDYQYPIKVSGESSYKLDSGKSMKMKDVLFVTGVTKRNSYGLGYHNRQT